ncbi:MAG: hypothetical protein V1912_11310 [bacterium]
MRRMIAVTVDPDGPRHSVWQDEGAAHPHMTTRTLSGTLVADLQGPSECETRRIARRRDNKRRRGGMR